MEAMHVWILVIEGEYGDAFVALTRDACLEELDSSLREDLWGRFLEYSIKRVKREVIKMKDIEQKLAEDQG